MKTIKKYGKSSDSVMQFKEHFINENDDLLKEDGVINDLYKKQPKRNNCKNCNYTIHQKDFVKQGIDYSICDNCGHLNGLNEDSDDFCKKVYESDDVSYLKNYSSNDRDLFIKRVEKMYVPKVDFLFDSLRSMGEKPENFSYADFGAGLGYFVSALTGKGCESVSGLEVSETNVKIANKMIGKKLVKLYSFTQNSSFINPLGADVISMIGVLEHLQNPTENLKALISDSKTKYIYISVPIFSITVFFEMIFPEVMQRHLSRDHTHLYTNKSLNWLIKDCGLTKVAEWWFGLDMVDLYRDINVKLSKNKNNSAKILDIWSEMFLPLVDSLQLEVDKKHLSSEVHLLLKKN